MADDALVTAPTVRTRFGEEVAVGDSAVAREVGVVGAVLLLLLLLLILMVVGVALIQLLLLLLLLVLAVASGRLTTVAAVVLVAIVVVGRSLMVVLREGLGVLVFVGTGSTESLVGVPGGDGLGPVPAAPTFAADEPRSPHIGSKCFNFQGSSLLFSFSASVLSFIWFSGVNSPSDNRSRHSRHARAKNSLFKLDGFNRQPFRSQSPASSTDGRSTDGSN